MALPPPPVLAAPQKFNKNNIDWNKMEVETSQNGIVEINGHSYLLIPYNINDAIISEILQALHIKTAKYFKITKDSKECKIIHNKLQSKELKSLLVFENQKFETNWNLWGRIISASILLKDLTIIPNYIKNIQEFNIPIKRETDIQEYINQIKQFINEITKNSSNQENPIILQIIKEIEKK